MALTYTKNREFNADGLTVYFPDATGTPTRGGELEFDGQHISEVYCTLADLPVLSADANGLLLADNVRIPGGAFIEKVSVFVTKEPTDAAGTANFNLGIVNASTMAITDANGLLAAADAFNAGTDLGRTVDYTLGTTGAGALVGTELASTSLLCAAYDTAAFTGGIIRIRVYWNPVLASDA
jgi:hypothetical protein